MICPMCTNRKLRLLQDDTTGEASCSCKSQVVLNYVKLKGYDREHSIAVAKKAVVEDEATCFHHADRQATAICGQCGILICDMCKTEYEGEALCLSCFSKVHKEKMPVTVDSLGAESTRYDRMALALATLPNLMIWPGLLCAPIALFIVIRRWKEFPYSVIPHSRANLIWASIFSVLTILVWGGALVGLSLGVFD